MTRLTIDRGAGQLCLAAMMAAAGVFLAGCGTPGRAADPGAPAGPITTSDTLAPGDVVKVDLKDIPDSSPALDVLVKEDGSITLPLLKEPIKAAGKKTGELERAIHDAYVPGYYQHMSVMVTALGQFYWVKGEVRSPNRVPFASAATVLKAITSAGDFTDFARKRHVVVRRADGRIEYEDCLKAIQNPRLDLPVYPGDLITVLRKTWPWQK